MLIRIKQIYSILHIYKTLIINLTYFIFNKEKVTIGGETTKAKLKNRAKR